MLRFEKLPSPPMPKELELPQGISPRLARMLYARGARTGEAMEAFLHPSAAQLYDPFLFRDMDKAVARLREAAEKGQRICVYGDYDVDGVCATAIMLGTLEQLGAQAFYHVPSRHREGYGMNLAAVEELAKAGTQLILTVDNGIKALEEIRLARELGMDVIVTDHHLCGDTLPDAAAILCHTLPGNAYPNPDLCGAGTAYKLACALLGKEGAMGFLPLVALATTADVMPLTGENRALVALGLGALNRGECCVGLQALNRVANPKGSRLTARDLAFRFAPRLNAAGRLEDAGQCVELLRTRDKAWAAEMAEALDKLNSQRKAEENAILQDVERMLQAQDLTDQRSILLQSPDWNPGVIGIAAARVAERYWRPTMLFALRDGLLTGSARSIPGVDIYKALVANEGLFTRFGGHAYAAGASLPAECFPALVKGVETALQAGEPWERFIPCAQYEETVGLGELSLALAEELSRLEPFGEGNPEPAFRTDGVLLRNVRRIGENGNHLKAVAVQGDSYGEVVAWGMGHRFDALLQQERCDMIYTPQRNDWNGQRLLQLRAEVLRGGEIQDPTGYLNQRTEKFVDAFSQNILYNKGCVHDVTEGLDTYLEEQWKRANGTLALCATQQGAQRLLTLLGERDLFGWVDVDFYKNQSGPCAYGGVVLAPILAQLDIRRYRRVVCYDGARQGVVEKLRALSPDSEILCGPALPLPALSFTREDMAGFYRIFRGSARRFYSREELADHLSALAQKPRYMACLAVDIMLELGFAKADQGIVPVPAPAQRDLMESELYAAIAALPQ